MHRSALLGFFKTRLDQIVRLSSRVEALCFLAKLIAGAVAYVAGGL